MRPAIEDSGKYLLEWEIIGHGVLVAGVWVRTRSRSVGGNLKTKAVGCFADGQTLGFGRDWRRKIQKKKT